VEIRAAGRPLQLAGARDGALGIDHVDRQRRVGPDRTVRAD